MSGSDYSVGEWYNGTEDHEERFAQNIKGLTVGYCDAARCSEPGMKSKAAQECGICGTKRCKICAHAGFKCMGKCGRWCCWDDIGKATPTALVCVGCA